MCNRYIVSDPDRLAERFSVEEWNQIVKPNYNVAPTHMMPVVTASDDGKFHIEIMKWGIPRVIGKDMVRQLTNTKSEKAFERFWKRTVTSNRCLVPATAFYEWKGVAGAKIPYYIHPKNEGLFAFAGIWDEWTGEGGQKINTYSIMTTEPNKEMRDIHNRMPVILHRENESAWLGSSASTIDDIEPLLRPYEDGGLEIIEASRDVNNVRNNYKELLPVTQ